MPSNDPQHDPVIFGGDPFEHERPPVENADQPTYRPPAHWPVITGVVIIVALLVIAVGFFVI